MAELARTTRRRWFCAVVVVALLPSGAFLAGWKSWRPNEWGQVPEALRQDADHYTGENLTSELDGAVERRHYEVLGKDGNSVVIHALDDKPSPLDGIFEVSTFHVVHFDGPDSSWLDSELGWIREYFTRLP